MSGEEHVSGRGDSKHTGPEARAGLMWLNKGRAFQKTHRSVTQVLCRAKVEREASHRGDREEGHAARLAFYRCV